MKSVYVETYGCSANQAHSEVIKGGLEACGIVPTDRPDKADAIVFNTCVVKKPTEDRIRERLKTIVRKFPEKTLVVTGCAADVGMFRDVAPKAVFLSSVRPEDVTRALTGRAAAHAGKARTNPLVGITEIASGCTGRCAYCIVRLAKGGLRSRTPGEIEKEVRAALADGCKEIWITSQDNSCYGFDRGENLVGLLRRLIKIESDFCIRVGMMNPAHLMPILGDIVNAYKSPKIYKFVHLPVQSGSDKVLRSMKRGYAVKDFEKIVSRFRETFPCITVSTDVIVGFPGEAEADFRKTLSLVKRLKPDIVNVSKFGPRPGTVAAEMKQVDNGIVKNRSVRLAGLVRNISSEKNAAWNGEECEILITERGKKSGQFVGRNEAYKPVVVESRENLMGRSLKVRVERCGQSFLAARIIRS